MKAEELMIGDLVNYRPGWINEETGKPEYECGDVFPVKITCIYDGLAQYDDLLPDGTINTIEVADYELSGIPITPEILEKNGFDINGIPEDMQPVEERDWSDDTYVWSRQETPDEAMEVSVYMDDPYNFFAEIICQHCHVDGVHIKYVHELQHALRLCGIEKEIVL